MEPTRETYQALQRAYDYFNKELFADSLPNCLLTLQRQRRTYGYFSADRFAGSAGRTDEIALNPTYFALLPVFESLSTLVHEQVHQWQERHGKPGRGRYHNKEWAAKMEAVGLMPSDTGEPGGKKVGDRVSHYVIEGGAFDHVAGKLLATGYLIPWADSAAEAEGEDGAEGESGKRKNKSNRLKFTCPDCGANAWGKPDLKLICGACRVDFVSPDAPAGDDEESDQD
ncbi:MAG TPA: SprT-like domain-containing protein [Terriglobia bacterium]|nr:SprT-like domain-containing protein [Terriglobia bacterium]